ncbi:MAG: hypothetical protein QM784_23415 [Polyangiaceae bacterium]
MRDRDPGFIRGRPDWTSIYYHRADEFGIGFDRTSSGSNAIEQYFPEVRDRFGSLQECPEPFLLWFHHVSWDHRLRSGRTLWEELCAHYQRGVDEVRRIARTWSTLETRLDPYRFGQVAELLGIQVREARFWRDACILYFQTFSKRRIPEGVEIPKLRSIPIGNTPSITFQGSRSVASDSRRCFEVVHLAKAMP